MTLLIENNVSDAFRTIARSVGTSLSKASWASATLALVAASVSHTVAQPPGWAAPGSSSWSSHANWRSNFSCSQVADSAMCLIDDQHLGDDKAHYENWGRRRVLEFLAVHACRRLDMLRTIEEQRVEHLVPEHLHWTSRQKTDNAEQRPFGDDAPIIGKVEHSLYPEFYYAHCDLSRSRDATGLVIAHVVGTKQVARLGENQQSVTETLPLIRIDLVQRFVAPPGGEIDIPRIRALFYQLRDRYGMEFGLITFDSFGSQESIKNLRDNAFKCENFSVDDDFTAYDIAKQAMYDERLLCYSHPKLQEELVRLERTAKKVDHPSMAGGSKDLADCLAAVVHHCEVGWAKGRSNGLFKIGIVE